MGATDVYSRDQTLLPEEIFAQAFNKLGGKFVFCENEQEMLENIGSLYDSRGWSNLVCADERTLNLFHNNKIDFVQRAHRSNVTAEACITRCEGIIGRTGSILLSSRQEMGRIAPIFYPVHIVIVYADEVLKDIGDALEYVRKKYKDGLPSMVNINTGPSRTADIEKTLVVGVHGPAEVFCFFVNA